MRLIASLLILSSFAVGCNSNDSEAKPLRINANDVRLSPVRRDSLSSNQLEKIRIVQATFSEVSSSTFDELVTNFRRDLNPDKEIAIWIKMAEAYKQFVSGNQLTDLGKKKEAYTLLLLRSMMTNEEAIQEAKVILLSETEVSQLLKLYGETPSPVTITR